MKSILYYLILLTLFAVPLEAQWTCWGEKYCWGCRRYMDPTIAGYDGIYYGYIDNINYPDQYNLPINYFFISRLPCRQNRYNDRYLQNCIHYTNQKSCEIPSS